MNGVRKTPVLTARLRFAALLSAAVVGAGVLGYRLIEGYTWLEAVWMVAITLTTIGYGEVRPLSDAGRVFTLGLLAGGIGVISFTFTQITRYVMDGGLRQDVTERRRRRQMSSMTDHYVVAGYGRLGAEVTAELLHSGRDVVVIDTDPDAVEQCEAAGVLGYVGDAASDELLREVGIERARGIAVASSSNAVNILVTLSARALSPTVRILTRIDSDEAARKAFTAGASDVISPYGLGGNHMAHGLLRPEARDFLQRATLRTDTDIALEDIQIGGGLNGELHRLNLQERYRVTLVAVRKRDGLLIQPPTRDTLLGPGDVMVAVGRPEDLQRLVKAAS
jgi:voltage-gated potassium channel